MSYKIVFFDIDGTLVNEEKQIPQDTIDAIRELKQTDVIPVIATGRAPYFFKPIAEQLGIDSYVSLNGAYVVHDGRVLFERPIARECLEALVEHAGKNNHPLVFEGGESYYANTPDNTNMMTSVNSLRITPPGHDPDFWQKESIYQAFLHCEAHEEELYADALPGLRLVRWHKNAMDVLPEDGSKALGIDAMLQHLGISVEEAVAFGDGLNDKEMLEAVGLGVAMGNSHPELIPHADYVTAHVNEGGIRQGLKHAGLL
ncbi:Cof-type HAD-IIB family hydrolase [Paenibacillus sp. PR3]|uniref:Cof-type HAD-IIB family hydrolase n=1 Tax=Paenibacillus terricola TaxID=2763503 RepID=A0ABR8N0A6_9BACL|nr:Cof-type HAD-IIB family hydrolase [Paenibacillus terricola]MBD3921280.1 Cof-type HAD-IIB family hydrolase [Paenibacillus terricola]